MASFPIRKGLWALSGKAHTLDDDDDEDDNDDDNDDDHDDDVDDDDQSCTYPLRSSGLRA